MHASWNRRSAAVGSAVLLALSTTALPAAAGPGASAKGDFVRLAAAAGSTLAGHAQVVRTGSDVTKLHVHLTGLTAGSVYGVHLHDGACSNAASPHYAHAAGSTAANELWASSDAKNPQAGVMANPAGVGRGAGKATWRARPSAASVVVHAPGTSARLLCADLS